MISPSPNFFLTLLSHPSPPQGMAPPSIQLLLKPETLQSFLILTFSFSPSTFNSSGALYLHPLSGLSRWMSHLDSAIFCPPCCPHKHHPFLKVQIIFPGRDGAVGFGDKRKREQNPVWVHVMAIGQFTPQLPTGATLRVAHPTSREESEN